MNYLLGFVNEQLSVIIDKNEFDDIMNNENSKIISLTELKNMFNNLIII